MADVPTGRRDVDPCESLERLVNRAVAGDLQSFDRLVERYQGAVFGLAYHWTRSFVDAQDVAQESLCLAFENLTELREPDRFPSWLQRITMNQCRKWTRAGSLESGRRCDRDRRTDG